mmetsp:Transcript_27366/g.38691  ORF Transcript_27366/g.38691 Transcript_27366/m.38691 type:complete len:89 (+) Transcript_27366:339-605(+)
MHNYTQGTINDWRIELLGPDILHNHNHNDKGGSGSGDTDEENQMIVSSTYEATSQDIYDYIAILFVANHCPHCKDFAPHVVASAAAFE